MEKWQKILFIVLIIFSSLFFRLYKFNQIPISLDWDEVAIGWNAASIWEAKIDQYGKRWPISFQSFGDYKAPFLIYATAPFVGLLGLKDWVIRTPSLICGLLSIPLFYLISTEIVKLAKFKKKQSSLFSLISTFLLSISAWHIRFSRVAFEPNVALFAILLAIYFLLLSLKNHYFYIFSGLFFIISLYTYHSPKIFAPIFLIGFFLIFKKTIILQFKKHYQIFFLYLLILVAITIPLIKETFFGKGGQRSTDLIFFQNGELVNFNLELLLQLFKNFITHLSPRFYLYGKDQNFRNNLLNYGLFTPLEYAFFIFGLLYLLKNKSQKYIKLITLWFIAALVPGILSKADQVPHSLRTLNALPSVLLITTFGFVNFVKVVKDKTIIAFENKIKVVVPALIIITTLFVFSIRSFYVEYFIKFPIYSGYDWQYGYKQVAKIAAEYEDKVDQIRITSYYGQPYLFTAFYQNRNPLLVMWGQMNNYAFVDKIDWEGDQFLANTLIVGTPEEIPANIPEDIGQLITEIKYPNNTVAFRIVETNQNEN